MCFTTNPSLEEWTEEEIANWSEDVSKVGRTAYIASTEAVIPLQIKGNVSTPTFNDNEVEEVGYCFWNPIVGDASNGYATIGKIKILPRRIRGFLTFFFQKSALIALRPSLKDLVISYTIGADPYVLITAPKYGEMNRSNNYAQALSRINPGESTNIAIVAHKRKLPEQEFPMDPKDIALVMDLSMNRFGNRKKGQKAILYPQRKKDAYQFRPKDISPTDIALKLNDDEVFGKDGGISFPSGVYEKLTGMKFLSSDEESFMIRSFPEGSGVQNTAPSNNGLK
jgi:hypothetical protein